MTVGGSTVHALALAALECNKQWRPRLHHAYEFGKHYGDGVESEVISEYHAITSPSLVGRGGR